MELLFSLPLEECEQPYAGQHMDYGGVFGAREEVYFLHNGQLTEYVVIDLREEWTVYSDKKYDEKYYTDKGYTVVKRCNGVGVVLKKGS